MKHVIELFKKLDETVSNNKRIQHIVTFLNESSDTEKKITVPLLSGTRTKSLTTSHHLQKIFRENFPIPDWLYKECYSSVGDTSELISLLINNFRASDQRLYNMFDRSYMLSIKEKEDYKPIESFKLESTSSHSNEVFQQITHLVIEPPKKRSLSLIENLVVKGWSALSKDEIFIFNKLLVGNLRIGVSRGIVAKALAAWAGVEEGAVQQFLTSHSNNFENLLDALQSKNDDVDIFPFCLAASWADAVNSIESELIVEAKFDGIRSQIVTGTNAVIWSRGEIDISSSFPDLKSFAQGLPNGTTLDGEIVAVSDGQIQSFNSLQKRLGRKSVSSEQLKESEVGFIAYDITKFESEDIRHRVLIERKEILHNFCTEHGIDFSPVGYYLDAINVSLLKETSRDLKIEGLMYKNINSSYTSGRKRGVWFKDKIDPMSLDAVLVYAQSGTGKRANLFTDYTFALRNGEGYVTFAKAYSGLDDKEIARVDHWIRRNTLERKGPVRILKPELIFEISFEGISRSNRHKSGISVRFPRITRWRHDKTLEDINSVDDAFVLLSTVESFRASEEGLKSKNSAKSLEKTNSNDDLTRRKQVQRLGKSHLAEQINQENTESANLAKKKNVETLIPDSNLGTELLIKEYPFIYSLLDGSFLNVLQNFEVRSLTRTFLGPRKLDQQQVLQADFIIPNDVSAK